MIMMFIGEVIYGIDMIPIKSIIFDLCLWLVMTRFVC